jgi:nucleotide-binding universal stress UspA family protein
MSTMAADRRRIVVGVDGSKPSVDALLWARLMGRAMHAELDVITSWQYPAAYGMAGWASDWSPQGDAAALLEDTLRLAFAQDRPVGLRTTVMEGHAANALVNASTGAELLVVGSRGHGGFVGLLLGATSAHCAEHAACSVLIAHNAPGLP